MNQQISKRDAVATATARAPRQPKWNNKNRRSVQCCSLKISNSHPDVEHSDDGVPAVEEELVVAGMHLDVVHANTRYFSLLEFLS